MQTTLTPRLAAIATKVLNRPNPAPADQTEALLRLHLGIHHNLPALRRDHDHTFRRYQALEDMAEYALTNARPHTQGSADAAVARANRMWETAVMPASAAVHQAEAAVDRDLAAILAA